MRIRVDSEVFGRELGLLEKIVARKVTIPALANVLVRADVGGLFLAATDADLGLSGPCAATVEAPGVLTVPARKLYEIVKALPESEITLATDAKGAVRLTAGEFDSRLQALPPDDFPALPEAGDAPVRLLSRVGLKRLVGQVRYAMSSGDQRYFLNGALLTVHEKQIGMVATDGYRLAYATADSAGAAVADLLIPQKAIDELAALLAEAGEADVAYAVAENQMFFTVDGRTLCARRLDGKFPQWERLLPKGYPAGAVIDRVALQTALRRVALLSSDSSRAVTLALAPGLVRVSASSAELGDAAEKVKADYAGAEVKFKVSGQYLADFVEAAAGATITLVAKDATSQVLVTDGPDYACVIMPMRRAEGP